MAKNCDPNEEAEVFVSNIEVQNLFEALTNEAEPDRLNQSDKDLSAVIASSTSASTSSSVNSNTLKTKNTFDTKAGAKLSKDIHEVKDSKQVSETY